MVLAVAQRVKSSADGVNKRRLKKTEFDVDDGGDDACRNVFQDARGGGLEAADEMTRLAKGTEEWRTRGMTSHTGQVFNIFCSFGRNGKWIQKVRREWGF